MFKKRMNQMVGILLAAGMFLLPLTGCGNSGMMQDSDFLKQVEQSVIEAQGILSSAYAVADELTQQTTADTIYANQEEYALLCRESSEKIDQAMGSIRKLEQDVDQFTAPQSEHGQAVYNAQSWYFDSVMLALYDMQGTLSLYIQQYDALQALSEVTSAQTDDLQAYLVSVYNAALQTKDAFLAFDTPDYLQEIWPKYCGAFDILAKYLESQSQAVAYGDVLRAYSANQIITRMDLVTMQYEQTIYDLMRGQYELCGQRLGTELKSFGSEIVDACSNGDTEQLQSGYMALDQSVSIDYSMPDEIYPNLYPSMDSAVNLLMYTSTGARDVMISAEIAGFSQTYEQKITLESDMTYLMIKPPVLAETPDLSAAKDTQFNLKITDAETGDILLQESKPIKIYSIYDYKNYSDEFGIIQNDNILAWMTPESDGVLAVRRNAIAWLEETFGADYGILPGYQYAYGFGQGQEALVTYYQVAAIQSAISNMGVRYNMGPYSLNAFQRVLMPDAVLESQSGICIETSVLMASVLQSANMHAMIVLTPGHAQVAVETWSGSGQYFLIETTALPFEATEAGLNSLIIPLDAQGWADYLAQKEQAAQESGGIFYIVDCDLAKVLNIKGLDY